MSDAPTEFQVEMVRVGPIEKHPDADTLSITKVYDYPVVIRTGDFKEGDLAVYVPVDSLVPTTRPEFAFLAKSGLEGERHRVRAMRLRGIFSMGLLVPTTHLVGYAGKSLAQELDIIKWVPAAERMLLKAPAPANAVKAPHWMPVYGIESARRHKAIMNSSLAGRDVVVTEKIHGCNARFCYRNGKLWVGSHRSYRGCTRRRWVELYERAKLSLMDTLGIKHRAQLLQRAGDVWWEAAETYDLKNKLKEYPNCVFYGEIYGAGVQDLEYGLSDRRFRVFDIFDLTEGGYLGFDEMVLICQRLGLDVVPVVYAGVWHEEIFNMSDGYSYLEMNLEHIREGIVVRTRDETILNGFGRLVFKVVGEQYLLRKTAA